MKTPRQQQPAHKIDPANPEPRRGRFKGIRTKVSPAELAALWGKKPSSIISLIKLGELPAIDVSIHRGRPRFLVDLADVELFESRRAVQPPIKPHRRRRSSPADETEFV